MAHRSISVYVALAAVALIAQAAHGTGLIELNDANVSAIGRVDVSKALGGVQDAYKGGFSFGSTRALRQFQSQCQLLVASLATARDSDFGGLAKQMKTVLALPSIEQACSVSNEQLTADFDQLDDLSKGDTIYPPHSIRVFNLLVSLTEKVDADPVLSQVAGHLVKSKVEEVTKRLLSSAPEDIEIMIGETEPTRDWFDFDTRYHKFCAISLIAPICKLVRDTPLEVSAIAADVRKFTVVLKSGSAQLADHIKNSGVSIDKLKTNCKKLQPDFRPISQIKKYLGAGLISEHTLEASQETDPSLDSYVALYDLCQVAAM